MQKLTVRKMKFGRVISLFVGCAAAAEVFDFLGHFSVVSRLRFVKDDTTYVVRKLGPLDTCLMYSLMETTGLLENTVLLMNTLGYRMREDGVKCFENLFRGMNVRRLRKNSVCIGDLLNCHFEIEGDTATLSCTCKGRPGEKTIADVIVRVLRETPKRFWVYKGGRATRPPEGYNFYYDSKGFLLLEDFISSEYFLLCIYFYTRIKYEPEIGILYKEVFERMYQNKDDVLFNQCFMKQKDVRRVPTPFLYLSLKIERLDRYPHMHLLPAYAGNQFLTTTDPCIVVPCHVERCVYGLMSCFCEYFRLDERDITDEWNDDVKDLLVHILTDGWIDEFDSKNKERMIETFSSYINRSDSIFPVKYDEDTRALEPGFVSMLGTLCNTLMRFFKATEADGRDFMNALGDKYMEIVNLSESDDMEEKKKLPEMFLKFLRYLLRLTSRCIQWRRRGLYNIISNKSVLTADGDLKIDKSSGKLVGNIMVFEEGAVGLRTVMECDKDQCMRFRVLGGISDHDTIEHTFVGVPILDAFSEACRFMFLRAIVMTTGERASEYVFEKHPTVPLIRGKLRHMYISYPVLDTMFKGEVTPVDAKNSSYNYGALHGRMIETIFKIFDVSEYLHEYPEFIENIEEFIKVTTGGNQQPLFIDDDDD